MERLKTASKATRRARLIDRLAAWAITLGGVLIIAAIVGIFVEIFAVTWPLFRDAHVESQQSLTLNDHAPILAAALDDYRETAYIVDANGRLATYNLPSGLKLAERQLEHPLAITSISLARAEHSGSQLLAYWADGAVSIYRSRLVARFTNDGKRVIDHELSLLVTSTTFIGAAAPPLQIARYNDQGVFVEAMINLDQLRLHRQERRENFLGDLQIQTFVTATTLTQPASYLLASALGERIFTVSQQGAIYEWSVDEKGLRLVGDSAQATTRASAVVAAALLLGDKSLLLGYADGGVAAWLSVRPQQNAAIKQFKAIHQHQEHANSVVGFATFANNKSFWSIAADGEMALAHNTSKRRLATLYQPDLKLVAINSRGDGMLTIKAPNKATIWRIDNPHPEISLQTLFGKVWYEGYDQPEYTWQSSSASDDFEPKLSLTPLISGTLKAAIFALLFSVPFALLAAVYANQFLSRHLHGLVKPMIELMAAFPSVVVGFVAALWLAPFLENHVVTLCLLVIFVPVVLVVWLALWRHLEQRIPTLRKRGIEYALTIPLVALAASLAAALAPPLETAIFDGHFSTWLYNSLQIRYDQRNALVIALALGFAVIPIIFTIADDALANVPRSLVAASLAVGASRWQTVWKVVLPSASPGIFAAIMIGLGRAVGETMIVLMATGNTPIMDWSPFNGMRTLSANIAVEIPEAPHDGTLYRVLFLSALLLFAFTFVANTLAELVRARLRKKYGRF